MAHRGTEKTLQKLKDSVNNGNYYEAHQMYRTVARRYNKQQKYKHAIQLLHDGAVSLMQHQQSASGSDLANYMLSTYVTAGTPVDAESLDRVVEILGLYPSTEPGRKPFIQSAFGWTQKHGDHHEGDPELHDYVGTMFYHEGQYGLAEEHLLVGTDESADLLGKVANEWAEHQNAVQKGLYLARALLQYLAMKNVHHATIMFKSFIQTQSRSPKATSKVRRAPADEPTDFLVYDDAWLNFSQLLLLTIQRDAAELFKQLTQKYAELYRDEKGFEELLEDIGLVFFNIAKPRKQANMLQDLMSSLFAGPPPGSAPAAIAPKPAKSSNVDLD
ncbi:hypothetical protein DFQ28_003463 [Apophysomyces sp. BC1034]|nr:hypothetical protein DFQ30_003835 [Apophysomyces sp. BC1015]KAG0178885.1 hypothetical protein DFQ29_002867 [Apophysomyces sp. BC1021]KAG0189414.1 hypothetical protein DFQ28_003463 [Apophysomyces sp. BC1034]